LKLEQFDSGADAPGNTSPIVPRTLAGLSIMPISLIPEEQGTQGTAGLLCAVCDKPSKRKSTEAHRQKPSQLHAEVDDLYVWVGCGGYSEVIFVHNLNSGGPLMPNALFQHCSFENHGNFEVGLFADYLC
jgi:hypothetical protein